MFSLHNAGVDNNVTITDLGFVTSSFIAKLRFQNVFRPHENEEPAFSNYSGLKDVFENTCFRDGLFWTVRGRPNCRI